MGSKERLFTNITAAHEEVTGSCISFKTKFPNLNTNRFITDCGIYQEHEYSNFNEELPADPNEVDAILITHGHADHIAKLPLEVKEGYKNPIYTTKPTYAIMKPALYDSAKVLRDISKSKGKKLIYQEIDVEKTLQLLVPCNYEKSIQIDEHTKATFFMNGHLLGAALILVQISYPGFDDINILFTGDYNSKNMFFDVPKLPDWVLELPLTIIQESTYGDMDRNMMEKKFRSNVEKAAKDGKTIVALVFSLGRAQEILYELKNMQDLGELSLDIPIYFDGKLAHKYTEMYKNRKYGIKEEMLDFLPQNLVYVGKFNRMSVLKDTNKKIIVTTSGMGNYGPAQSYLPEYVQRENTLIHFTGYTAEGTMGRKLKNAQNGEIVQIGGIMARKRAELNIHQNILHIVKQMR